MAELSIEANEGGVVPRRRFAFLDGANISDEGRRHASVTGGLVATDFWCVGHSCYPYGFEWYVDPGASPGDLRATVEAILSGRLER